MTTFVVERGSGEKTEVQADYAVQDVASTRVTFYSNNGIGEGTEAKAVGSFINVQAWYEKAAA